MNKKVLCGYLMKKGLQKINENMNKSFYGSFNDALKNGYDMHKKYVIVDWVYFHKLLKEELEGEE